MALDREKEIFETQLAEMKTTFQGLASETLEASNASFLSLATERIVTVKPNPGLSVATVWPLIALVGVLVAFGFLTPAAKRALAS